MTNYTAEELIKKLEYVRKHGMLKDINEHDDALKQASAMLRKHPILISEVLRLEVELKQALDVLAETTDLVLTLHKQAEQLEEVRVAWDDVLADMRRRIDMSIPERSLWGCKGRKDLDGTYVYPMGNGVLARMEDAVNPAPSEGE